MGRGDRKNACWLERTKEKKPDQFFCMEICIKPSVRNYKHYYGMLKKNSKNQITQDNQEWRPFTGNNPETNRNRNKPETMEVGRASSQKTRHKNYKKRTAVEPTGARKRGRPRAAWGRGLKRTLKEAAFHGRIWRGWQKARKDWGCSYVAYILTTKSNNDGDDDTRENRSREMYNENKNITKAF